MKKITQRQQTTLDIITSSIREKGYPPTLKELAAALGVSSRNSAVKHLAALTKKKYIVWENNKARGIRLLEKAGGLGAEQEVRLPLVGAVTAGVPMLAEENIERYISVPHSLVRSHNRHFLLKVQGESMKDAGILNKDLVIVRSQATANPGDVVVALIESEATVKRLAEKKGQRFLKAENPDFADIYPVGEWSVQGRVVALLRENIE